MRRWLRVVAAVAGREVAATLATPIASVFLVIFLLLLGVLTFDLGGFLDRDQADLAPFFTFIPWVFLLLVPALSMRLWAEERRSGTIETLLALPLTQTQAMLGKFAAGWLACALALLLTFPFVVTVVALGAPDLGVIATGYVGAWLLAGAFLAVGCAMSAAAKAQVVAFVATLALCFAFAATASPILSGFLSGRAPAIAEFGRRISLSGRYEDFTRGVVELRDLLFFASFIGFWLFLGVVVLTHRRAA